jgi:hypothetical protein
MAWMMNLELAGCSVYTSSAGDPRVQWLRSGEVRNFPNGVDLSRKHWPLF